MGWFVDIVLKDRYGNFGGSGYTNGHYAPEEEPYLSPPGIFSEDGTNPLLPIDKLDRAFLKHDKYFWDAQQYEKAGNFAAADAERYKGNLELLADISKLRQELNNNTVKLGGRGQVLYFAFR